MADPNNPKTEPTCLAPNGCRQTNPEGAEPVRCRVCNRPLKTEAPIAAGVGPTCAEKLGMLDSESKPPRKRKRIPVDPNQLGLFDAMQPRSKGFAQEVLGGRASEPGKEEQPPGDPCGELGCTITVKVMIVCPDGRPTLHVVISRGGVACKGC